MSEALAPVKTSYSSLTHKFAASLDDARNAAMGFGAAGQTERILPDSEVMILRSSSWSWSTSYLVSHMAVTVTVTVAIRSARRSREYKGTVTVTVLVLCTNG